jgi:lipopolysaccharide export system ATP-binding protein
MSRRWCASSPNAASACSSLSLVDRAYLIHDGRVMIQGKPEVIAADPEARRVYLGDSFAV